MAVVETEGLTKAYDTTIAVDDLTLQVEEGEVLGLLGPNGAGKTTTIRMLAGIIAPSAGRAWVAGLDPCRDPERLHEMIGVLPESPGFYGRLSAWRNLEYFAGFYTGLDVAGQVEKYLKAVRLWDQRDEKVGTFSKGMKQRLAIARALLHEPKVLFLDEPTAGLDPAAAREVRATIERLGREGRTILLSTHNLAEAELLCRRVAILQTRLLALDTSENLRQQVFRPETVVEMQHVGDLVLKAVRSLPYVENLQQEEDRLIVQLRGPETAQADLVDCIVKAGGKVRAVSQRIHSLEEVYFSLIAEEEGDNR